MRIDITLEITEDMLKKAPGQEQKSLIGHIGTHFDAMDKPFPLEYTRRAGIVFDVSAVRDRDIDCGDIPAEKLEAGMFAAFYTGFIEEIGYGQPGYFGAHPQLSEKLIELLLDKGVSIIGIDCSGIRRGAEHTPMDQHCADRGTFVVENLWGLRALVDRGGRFTANTYPMRCAGMTGLPCRVIAEVDDEL